MNESESPRPVEDKWKRRNIDYIDLAFAILCAAILVVLAWKENLGSYTLLGLLAIYVPYFLIGLRACNRLRHRIAFLHVVARKLSTRRTHKNFERTARLLP